ncbi:6-pyruvoyl-tetrahydropterin synthase [Mesorhizobium plurifarium]|uniref:6-pyruvoyl-tetrahydropterin synthase n=1 Tax=Mesorhizobium plurifarium TaxID=69974 RepID=A0A090E1N2_MESPL|nr:6-pyruvoyl-tetrahydropterin synthase [Mesorhizobium plurifarium]
MGLSWGRLVISLLRILGRPLAPCRRCSTSLTAWSVAQDLPEEGARAFRLRRAEECLRFVLLHDLALIHEDHTVCHRLGKTHFMSDAEHRHALLGERNHRIEHFLDHLRIESRSRFIEQHYTWLHAQRPRDRHALLLTARELARILMRLIRYPDLLEEMHGYLSGLPFWYLADPDRGEGAVLEDSQVWKEIEVLEHHPDFATDFLDLFEVVGQLNAVDDDLARLMVLEPVDAADHGRFAGAGWPANDDPLSTAHSQIDVSQGMKITVPLVHGCNLDGRF